MTVRSLPGARLCPNGHRWERCRAIMNVDGAGMRPVKCDCRYKRDPSFSEYISDDLPELGRCRPRA